MTASSAYFLHTYSGFEPLQAFDIVYGGHFEHRLLRAGNTTMEHQRLQLGEVRLESGCYDFPVIAQGSMPDDALCIGFVLNGHDTTRYNLTDIAADDIQLYPGGVELLYHARRASRWINFTTTETLLQQTALQRRGRPLPLRGGAAHSITLPAGRRGYLGRVAMDAFALARSLASTGGIGEALERDMSASLLGCYVDALSDAGHALCPHDTAVGRHQHLIRACERLLVEGGDADIALGEIARRSGYSHRALQLIFRRSVGMTPGRWFLGVRLNGALRDLITAPASCTVSEVATRWGFHHYARFSAQYRDAFGELPSRTLQRNRARLSG
ncbi:AraC family transcriptional regulator [Cupriavidus necator]|uniref:AraC family transcriptional regulator n=1 Tax=Cupriavidus necator TaxID=106590 RepID=UPI001F26664B|nr:helix-turn-helix domain-containing protein [Cupriavidus necator]